MELGEAATELLKAAIRGTGWPGSVPETAEFRKLYEDIQRDIADLPPGVVPEIPFDYNDPPDPDPIGPPSGGGGSDGPEIEQFSNIISAQLEMGWQNELRDSRGRWTRFGQVGQAADVMSKNREGFSVSVQSGREPAHGFMVAQLDHTHTYPASILDDHAKLTRAIDDMLVKEKAAFRGQDTYLGGWVHDGKLWLEPSDNIADREHAISEGTSRNQIAVWDVDHGQEIDTGGSGGGRIFEHANIQGDHWPGTGELRRAARGRAAGDRGQAGSGHPAGAAAQLNFGWRFDPAEERDAHGEWTRGGKGYVAPDHSRLILPHAPKNSRFPFYRAPEDHPFFKAHPVSAANVVASYDASTPGERAQGMRWYADAGALAKAIGHGDQAKGAGLLASYSPQTPWPANMFNAARSMELGHALGHTDGMISGAMQRSAQAALDGVPIEENFGKNKAPKIRAFAHLIASGGDAPDEQLGHVAIDRHAMTVAMGTRLPKKEADTAPLGTDRYYQHVADQYRQAALEITKRGTPIAPHQIQAITWLHQQAVNAAMDENTGHGTAASIKGRAQLMKNSWQRWDTEAEAEGLPVNYGTTALAGIADQVLELGWKDAWLHEHRDSHGRWTRGADVPSLQAPKLDQDTPIGEQYDGEFSDKVLQFHRHAHDFVVKRELNVASADIDAGDWGGAAAHLRQAARVADRVGEDGGETYRQFADRMVAAAQARNAPVSDSMDLLEDTARNAAKMLGGGHEIWTGKLTTFGKEYTPDGRGMLLGDLDWDGNMRMTREVVDAIQQAKEHPDQPLKSPELMTTPLHELFHGVIPDGEDYKSNMAAYQQRPIGDIEEGFNQLATLRHEPEMLKRQGIENVPTLATDFDDDGKPFDNPERHAAAEQMKIDVAKLIHTTQEGAKQHGAPYEQAAARLASALGVGEIDNGFIGELGGALTEVSHLGDHDLSVEAQRLQQEIGRISGMPFAAHMSLRRWYENEQRPDTIQAGGNGGIYGYQTKMAWQWVAQVAIDEDQGDNIRDVNKDFLPGTPGWKAAMKLSDEINQEGPAKKPVIMAKQIIRNALKGGPDEKLADDPEVVKQTVQRILAEWKGDNGVAKAFIAAHNAARATAHSVALERMAA